MGCPSLYSSCWYQLLGFPRSCSCTSLSLADPLRGLTWHPQSLFCCHLPLQLMEQSTPFQQFLPYACGFACAYLVPNTLHKAHGLVALPGMQSLGVFQPWGTATGQKRPQGLGRGTEGTVPAGDLVPLSFCTSAVTGHTPVLPWAGIALFLCACIVQCFPFPESKRGRSPSAPGLSSPSLKPSPVSENKWILPPHAHHSETMSPAGGLGPCPTSQFINLSTALTDRGWDCCC